MALNTAIFSILTGLSRVAGLFREILASSYFATSGAFSAFTLAFQVPNLLRMLVADQAVSAAFVPVFTDLLEKGNRRQAFQLASTLFFLILAVLGAITALFVLLAPVVMPLFTGGAFDRELDLLVSGLAQVLFPIVVLLGLNGLTLGILYAYDDFTIGALAPLAWNLVIIVLLVALRAAVRRSRSAVRVRDRRAGRDDRAVRDDPAAPAPLRLPADAAHRPARPAPAPGAGADAAGDRRAWA